jgi:hypothetical protein
MKKLILTFGIFLAGIFFVNAQDKGAAKLVDRLTQVCSLTPDQASKMQPIAEDYAKTRKANKQQYASDPAGLKAANKAANKNFKAQRDAILTPDQQQKLKAYNAQKRAGKQGGQGGEDQEGGGQQ